MSEPGPRSQVRERRQSIAAARQEAASLGGPLTLRDGAVFSWRAIRADDAERLRAFHSRLSHQTLFYRFFGEMPVLSHELAERLCQVNYRDRMAIVAKSGAGADEPIIAVARYEATEPEAAEMALVIEDRWQGQGIGPQLLMLLAAYARRSGFTTFIANVKYDNDHMLIMLRHSGFPSIHRLREGHVEARLDITKQPDNPPQ
jgi:GNAT superfamily N-acetyltransferase